MSRNLFLKWLLPAVALMIANTMDAQDNKKSDQLLTAQQQSIVSISALTAAGDIEQLKIRLNAGLDAGLTINEIKEVLVQLYAYCGFPRSLNGINTFMSVIQDRKAKGIRDPEGKDATPIHDSNKYLTGKSNLQRLTGREEKTPAGANAFAPAIDTFLKEHLFADIFSRDILTYQQRELVTVSALAAMSGVAPQLQSHIFNAMNMGVSQSQLLDAFAIIDRAIGKKEGDLDKKVRIAKIEVYPAYLEAYKAALAEHAKTAVREERGVLALQAVYDKVHPTQVTVFEVYASDSAYQAHLKTPHFLKYKSGTLKMVKSLELAEVAPIAMEIKPELIQNKE
jgi:alkylhydroperoxidase/carboxymuconolactone decarboxylase family protein YurZ/quinol monooxygenase YgiN